MKPPRPTEGWAFTEHSVQEHPVHGGTADVVKTYTLGTFDVADVAAKPQRVVHTRLLTLSTL